MRVRSGQWREQGPQPRHLVVGELGGGGDDPVDVGVANTPGRDSQRTMTSRPPAG